MLNLTADFESAEKQSSQDFEQKLAEKNSCYSKSVLVHDTAIGLLVDKPAFPIIIFDSYSSLAIKV